MFELNLMLAEPLSADICPLELIAMNGLCQQALEQQQLKDLDNVDQIDISLQLLDSDAMQSLNYQYRQKDSATNVLSFESDLPVLRESDAASLLMLGDIVLCPEVIALEAQQQGKNPAQHWAHLLVHGTLHLCGYDHVHSYDAALMEELEIQILSKSGVPNPYQTQSAL